MPSNLDLVVPVGYAVMRGDRVVKLYQRIHAARQLVEDLNRFEDLNRSGSKAVITPVYLGKDSVQ